MLPTITWHWALSPSLSHTDTHTRTNTKTSSQRVRSDCWHWYQVTSCCWAVHLAAWSEDRVGSSQRGPCHCALGQGWRQIRADIEDNIGINGILWCLYHIGITVQHDDMWGWVVSRAQCSPDDPVKICCRSFAKSKEQIHVMCVCEPQVAKLWDPQMAYFQPQCQKLPLKRC